MFNVGDEVKVVAIIEDSNMVINKTGTIEIIKRLENKTRYKIRFEGLQKNSGYWWVNERALKLILRTPEEEFWNEVKRWQQHI